jgi:hypothetical protein
MISQSFCTVARTGSSDGLSISHILHSRKIDTVQSALNVTDMKKSHPQTLVIPSLNPLNEAQHHN